MSHDTLEKSRHSANPVECYRIQSGSTTWRYTSADQRVSISVAGDGVFAYVPEALSRGELSFSQEESSGVVEITVPRWNPVAKLFIPFTPPNPINLTIYRLHADDGSVIIAFRGSIVRASFSGSEAVLTCAPVAAALSRSIPRIACQARCSWALYSAGCTIDPEDFKDVGTVASVSGLDVTATVFGTQVDGWFTLGYLELSDGTRRRITAHVGNTATLQSPIIGLTAGTAFSAFAGCDLLETTCVTKFNNLVNHMGHKRLPTRNPYQLGMT